MRMLLTRQRALRLFWLAVMFAGVLAARTELFAVDDTWCEAETSTDATCYWHPATNGVCEQYSADFICEYSICPANGRSYKWGIACSDHAEDHDFVACRCGGPLPE
jgi:hypothetical protein